MARMRIRHKQVIDNYFLNGFNQVQAMLSAGYTDNTARNGSYSVFGREDVKAEIERRQARITAKVEKKIELTADWAIERMMKIADFNIGDIMRVDNEGDAHFDLSQMTPDMAYAIRDFQVETYTEGRGPGSRPVKKMKVTGTDKLAALTALMRHLGLFNDKVTVQGELSLIERLQAGRTRANKKNTQEE